MRAAIASAWCYTGSYQCPPHTLTGTVRGDIVFVDPIVGVGELAISDHRSSQPTFDELVRVAADCHVAGLTSGKAGHVHLHLGDGDRGLALVRRAVTETELPARVFQPTHVNRNRRLFDEALALATAHGVPIDVTAFPADDDAVGITAMRASAPPDTATKRRKIRASCGTLSSAPPTGTIQPRWASPSIRAGLIAPPPSPPPADPRPGRPPSGARPAPASGRAP